MEIAEDSEIMEDSENAALIPPDVMRSGGSHYSRVLRGDDHPFWTTPIGIKQFQGTFMKLGRNLPEEGARAGLDDRHWHTGRSRGVT
mgnify:CR=1 FL=1